jgi:hypothetical protein
LELGGLGTLEPWATWVLDPDPIAQACLSACHGGMAPRGCSRWHSKLRQTLADSSGLRVGSKTPRLDLGFRV